MCRAIVLLGLLWVCGCDSLNVLVFEPEIPEYQENYSADIIIEGVGDMRVHEGESMTVRVRLSQAPSGSVLVPLSVSDPGELSVSTSSLVFNALTWKTPQEVVLTGLDDKTKDGDQPVTLSLGPGSSTQGRFGSVKEVVVSLTVVDGVCGNGVVDGTEACEPVLDGTSCVYGMETCAKECSPLTCQLETPDSSGFCGDGVVQRKYEECDESEKACEYGMKSCVACHDCKRVSGIPTGFCGDGVVQDIHGESCDGVVESAGQCGDLGLAYGQMKNCEMDCSFDVMSCYKIVDVQASKGFTCALSDAGDVYCWGVNGVGQLGNGGFLSSVYPQRVEGLSRVTKIALGYDHVCAIQENGRLYCWGGNESGQLGDGSSSNSSTPRLVGGISGVMSVSAGEHFSCALKNDGHVYCWGRNYFRQLGNETIKPSLIPIKVKGVGDVTTLASNYFSTCVVRQDKTAYCWGKSSLDSWDLSRVGEFDDVETLYGGGSMFCLKSASQGTHCWGSSARGVIGDGTDERDFLPERMEHLESFSSVSFSPSGSCAVTQGQEVKCWGDNGSGQLGRTTSTALLQPGDAISGLSGVKKVTIGSDVPRYQGVAYNGHVCALLNDGRVKCWGDDREGQLGLGGGDGWEPKSVPGLTSVRQVVSGRDFSCSLLFSGEVKCWGENGYGQLGRGTNKNSHIPEVVSLPSGVQQISADYYHVCALLQNDEIWCWGDNSYGIVGGDVDYQSNPVRIDNMSGVFVALGVEYSCAIQFDGRVRCWGLNARAKVRPGFDGILLERAYLPGLPELIGMDGGFSHTCALSRDRTLYCWGYNHQGIVGVGAVGSDITPLPVSSDRAVSGFSVGFGHSCYVDEVGEVYCWGGNYYGELGVGGTNDQSMPALVSGVGDVSSVSVGRSHTCATTNGGEVYCWGFNDSGRLGVGDVDASAIPVIVRGLSGVADVSSGGAHTCVRMQDNTVQCWGSNSSGQLGRPIRTSVPTPTLTKFP